MTHWLSVRGREIVGDAGQPVRLRGVGLGGWLNMENFVTGYPGTESQQRGALAAALGAERAGHSCTTSRTGSSPTPTLPSWRISG